MTLLSRQTPFGLTLAIAAALGLLALLLVVTPSVASWGWGGSSISMAAEPPRLPQFETQSLATYAAIGERPIFNPGHAKDPLPPPPEMAKPQLPSLDNYRLAGLVISPNVHIALIERRGNSQVMSLRPGENLDGRTVVDVQEKGVTLMADGHEEMLTILPPSTLSPGPNSPAAVRP